MKKGLFGLGLIRSLLVIAVVAAVVGVIGTRLAEGEPPPPRTGTLPTPPVPTEPSMIPAHVVRWVNVTLTLPADSGTFDDRGEHELKGVGEPQRLFAVRGGGGG